MSKDPLMSIGFVAKRTGIAVSAMRFYADEELIPCVRSASGHRMFPRSAIRRVSFILIAQNLGYSLSEIKAALQSLPDSRTPTKADWDRLSKLFSKDIEDRIARLSKLKASLAGCIGCGCLSLQRCRLYNPDDEIADKGPGARFLLGDRSRRTNELSNR